MKTIGIFFSKESSLPEHDVNGDRLHALRDMIYELEQLGCDAVLVADDASLEGDGRTFTQSWSFHTSYGLVSEGRVEVDAIFARGKLEKPVSVPLINNPKLRRIMTDKMQTYRMFSDYMPTSYVATSQSELEQSLTKLNTERIVIKPESGSFSEGVTVCERSNAPKDIDFPVIVQDFIDTSCGIDSVTPDEHDLRIVMINDAPSLAMVRVPQPGSHVAGMRKGATTYFPELAGLPDSIHKLVATVDARLVVYPNRVYSIDIGMSTDGPKIIELNSNPAIWPSKEHPFIDAHNKRLATHLSSLTA